jgi:U3 small nucleolar RNA-associated protein 13
LANLKIRGAQGQKSLTEVLSALKVYSDRHYKRTEELFDQSYLLEYTLREMEGWVLLENEHVNGFEKDEDQDVIMA